MVKKAIKAKGVLVMNDGLYLSTYLHIDPFANVIENYFRHDHNFSLWRVRDNSAELMCYYELERYTRIKQHKYAFDTVDNAKILINNLIKEYDISIDDISGIWGTPLLSDIDIEHIHNTNKFCAYPLHSMAHLFSGIKSTNSDSVLCLAIDQGPDNILKSSYDYDSHYIATVFRNGRVEYPVSIQSPAPIWFELSEVFRLREGTLMALGSASTCEYIDTEAIIKSLSKIELYNANKLHDLKILINNLNRIVTTAQEQMFINIDPNFTIVENRISAIVKIIQKYSIGLMCENVKKLINHYNINPKDFTLSITGGYALNCPTNTFLTSFFGFKGFSSPPCVSDTGISLGYAEYLFHLQNIQTCGLQNPFYGSISNYHGEMNYDYTQIVRDLINAPIVWLQGRSEVGPRALGHRSILAESTRIETKNSLNSYKKREWWRPVAPIVLEEHVKSWFEDADRSPYMLQTYKVKESKKHLVPAILHLDNTARVQTLCESDNPNLYKVIEEYYKVTGIPIICNTSLNDKGEPIIETLSQALRFARNKGINIVYYNGIRLESSDVTDDMNYGIELRMNCFARNEIERLEIRKQYNPYNLDREIIQFYYDFPEINKMYSLTSIKDIITVLEKYRGFLNEGNC